jgi:hypothetical protein
MTFDANDDDDNNNNNNLYDIIHIKDDVFGLLPISDTTNDRGT